MRHCVQKIIFFQNEQCKVIQKQSIHQRQLLLF